MRVLQINSVCGVGSTGRIVADIHKSLKEKGYESYIAYGRGETRNCDSAIRIGSDLDVYGHVALTRIFDKHGFGSKRATLKFLKIVEKLDPDLIHLHNIHGYYINIEDLFNFLKAFDKPVVWTLHDCWAFTGHCSHFLYAKCDRWKTGCYSCPEKSSYPKSFLLDSSEWNHRKKRELFTGVKKLTLVTPSKWLASLVKESFLSEYEVKVIPNGIDTRVFKPTHSDFRQRFGLEDKFVILGVANVWSVRKGLNFFIELSNHLTEDEVIVLVGLTQKQVKKLPKNIIGITRTKSTSELAGIYTTADVFFNPTLEDNYPTVNLEAQACGTYVITFDPGGAAETVVPGLTGDVISSPYRLERIIRLIRNIKLDRNRYRSKLLFSDVGEQLSSTRMTTKYIELYETISLGRF
ncbi:glycosyltransferase [Fervidobacterium pennivorans subsp. carthaginiensis]|uniref:glycosyltransferase n=1 Tax=Fervidobacterium pennivorans TaxID=93466 RepID=UPI00355C148B